MRHGLLRRVTGFVSMFGVALLIPHLVLADIVALRDGTELHGAVANREKVADNPDGQKHVSILIEDTGEFRSVPVDDILYVVLIDDGGKRVIEFEAPVEASTPLPAAAPGPATKQKKSSDGAVALMVIGGAVAVVGAAVKFGDEELNITPNAVDYSDKTYNTANYVMMVGGGAMFLVGLTLVAKRSRAAEHTMIDVSGRDMRLGVRLSLP